MPSDGSKRRVKDGVKRCGDTAARPVRWTGRQASGFAGGVQDLIGSRDQVLPQPALDTWGKIKRSVPEAFGTRGDATAQITSSIMLGALAFASSVVTAGATVVLVGLFALTGLVGVLRLIPAVGDTFENVRDGASRGGESWTRGR